MYYEYNFERVVNMGNLKALFSIVLDDCFKISGCEIHEASNGELYVLMPKISNDRGTSYVNINNDSKKKIFNEIINDYKLNNRKTIHKIIGDMKYTVNVNYMGQSKLKAFVKLDIGFMQINGIRILENNKGNIFVSMPSYKTELKDETGNDVYKYIANPVTKEFYKELNENILKIFDNACIKNEPDEIKLLIKTIEEYSQMMDKAEYNDIPDYITKINAGEDVELNMILIGEAVMQNKARRESIIVANKRIEELRNQIRRNGSIDDNYKSYNTLFNNIGEGTGGLAPSQKEMFHKKIESIAKKNLV